MFPEIPADLQALEDEALAALRDELLAQIKQVGENRRDPDVVGELTQAQVADELTEAVTRLETVKNEIQAREDEAAAYDQTVSEQLARAGVDASDELANEEPEGDDGDGNDDEEGDGDAAAAKKDEKEPEAVAAAATKLRPLPAARRHKPTPAEHDDRGLRVTSHAAGLGTPWEAGSQLSRKAMGEFLNELVRKSRIRPGQRAVVAAARYDYPEERVLEERDGPINTEKVQAVLDQFDKHVAALVASGAPANCAPFTPIYDLPGVETAVRPVRDALPSFQAARGGVIVGAAPGMGDYEDATGHVTSDDNETGGTYAAKDCMHIECPEFTSVAVDSFYTCIEADNLGARAYPELMARIDELVRAEQARQSDGFLLTRLQALSTAVTGGGIDAGAVWELFGDIYTLAAGYRSRNRMPDGAMLQVLMPAWIVDLLALDIVRGQYDPYKTRQQVISLLGNANISVSFYLDGSADATDGQVFGAQTAGPIVAFPDTVQWFLFAPGTFLHLDSGSLELGIVRDSTLNASNDFQVFAETWENVVRVGHEAEVVTTTICPSGERSAAADVSGFCGT